MALNNCSSRVQESLMNLNSRQTKYSVSTGAIDLALSAANGAEVQAKMITKNGKNSHYNIEYPLNLCEAVQDCDDFDCNESVDAPMTGCLPVEGFMCYTSKWIKIGVDEWRDLGNVTNKDLFSIQVMDQMNKIMIEVEKQAIISLCTNAGCIDATTQTRDLKLISPTTGAPQWATGDTIDLDYADAGYETNPLLLGGRPLYSFAKAQGRFGTNNDGLRVDALQTYQSWYTKFLTDATCAPTTAGRTPILAVMPGVFNLVNWSYYAGIFATREDSIKMDQYKPEDIYKGGPGHERSMMMHPTKNWMFDFEIKYRDENCTPTIYWRIKTFFQPVFLPLLGCKDDCFTGIIKYDTCEIPATAC